MWELKSRGVIQTYKTNVFMTKPCPICNQYLRKDEEVVAIVIPFEFRGRHKRLKENFNCHKDEWFDFCKDCKTDEELAIKLINHKSPKRKPLKEEDTRNIHVFADAAYYYGFTEAKSKRYGIRMKKPKSSVYTEYNVYADQFIVEYNNTAGLFESFIEEEMGSKIQNKINELLENNKKVEVKNASEKINEVVKKAIENIK